jgi:D-tyrosyl-tRNA(Tyr) deacylase
MISVVQRVSRAAVTVASPDHRASIGRGLVVLLGVEQGDSENEAAWMAGKIARLRIFPDDQSKMNRSVQDVGGQILLVSQFTLAGDCDRGNRPSFASAASPEVGQRLYERVGMLLASDHALSVNYGRFGAMMQVELVNDGPVTLILRKQTPA